MSLMVASTRWKDELSCSCSCDAPWFDWLCSWGAKLNVARENKVREMQSFIFLLQEIWFETTFGEGARIQRGANYPTRGCAESSRCCEKPVLPRIDKGVELPICDL